jgi:hypothetical protein
MKIARLMAAGVLSAFLFAPISALADEPCPEQYLCGITHVTVDSSASASVFLPGPATVDLSLDAPGGAPRDLVLDSSPPFSGIVLVSQGPGERRGFFVGKHDGTALAEYGAWTVYSIPEGRTVLDGVFRLEAGTYQLQVIAPGPTAATIRFRGLSGEKQLQPTDPAGLEFKFLEPRSPTGQRNLFWAGENATLSRDGFGFLTLGIALESPASVVTWGHCLYESDPPEEQAYLPGCPNRATHPGDPFVGVLPNNGVFFGYQVFAPSLSAGTSGMGVWYQATAVVRDAAALAVWVSWP